MLFTCHLWALLSFVFVYDCHIIHILHGETIFTENIHFCERIKSKIICNPDLIFRLSEHLATLTLYTALPLYHLEEMCYTDLILWSVLLFGTWEYANKRRPWWCLMVSVDCNIIGSKLQIMALCRPANKPLHTPMMNQPHCCIYIRSQWHKISHNLSTKML